MPKLMIIPTKKAFIKLLRLRNSQNKNDKQTFKDFWKDKFCPQFNDRKIIYPENFMKEFHKNTAYQYVGTTFEMRLQISGLYCVPLDFLIEFVGCFSENKNIILLNEDKHEPALLKSICWLVKVLSSNDIIHLENTAFSMILKACRGRTCIVAGLDNEKDTAIIKEINKLGLPFESVS